MFNFQELFTVKKFSLLLYLNGLLWFVFSIWLFLSDRSNDFYGTNIYDLLAVLMFLNFLIFLFLAYGNFKRYRWVYYFTVFYLSVNLLLTFTDKFGLLDIIVLSLNLMSLIYCYFLRNILAPKIDIKKETLMK